MSLPEQPVTATPGIIVCADWSKAARKRAVYVARVEDRTVHRADHSSWTFAEVIALANSERERGSALVAFDVPIGVPRSYLIAARSTGVCGGAEGFLDWLPRATASESLFAPVGIPTEWSVGRPFFTVHAGPGGRRRFEDAARIHGVELQRHVDRVTGAKPVFAFGLPGQVAPAAQALWQELASALMAPDRPFRVWPFEGTLGEILGSGRIAVAEMYPRAAYATALASSLPTRPRAISKTKCSARRSAVESLQAAAWVSAFGVMITGEKEALDGEDEFDAMMTAAALLRCALEGRPMSAPSLEDRVAEGGILGSGTLTFEPSRRKRKPGSGDQLATPDSR